MKCVSFLYSIWRLHNAFNLKIKIVYYRGAVDESGEQFVAYFLPTDETLGKRKRDAEVDVEYVPDEE